MTSKAKPILIIAGAILITFFPVPRWIATRYVLNVTPEYFSYAIISVSVVRESQIGKNTIEDEDREINAVFQSTDVVAKENRNAVEIKQRPNSFLWEVGVYDIDPTRAADKANLIADRAMQEFRIKRKSLNVIAAIRQPAVPAKSPTRPNVQTILDSADIIGWLLCVIGVVLVLFGVLRKPKIPQAAANAGPPASKE